MKDFTSDLSVRSTCGHFTKQTVTLLTRGAAFTHKSPTTRTTQPHTHTHTHRHTLSSTVSFFVNGMFQNKTFSYLTEKNSHMQAARLRGAESYTAAPR